MSDIGWRRLLRLPDRPMAADRPASPPWSPFTMPSLSAAVLRVGAVLAAVLVLGTAGAAAQGYPPPGPLPPGAVIVPGAPPPPRAEAIPAPPPGRVAWVWRPGHWVWGARHYVWVPGRYVRPPRRHVAWAEGHWVQRRGGWVWVPGHWR